MREFQVSNHLLVRLEEKRGGKMWRITAGLVTLLSTVILSLLTHIGILIAGVVIFFILMAPAFSSDPKEKILKEGISGEDTLKNRLKKMLSDEYIGLFNLPLPTRGDIDCFVIGPTGAYLFDVKNHNGYVLCCDGEWTQMKVGRKGTAYEGEHLKNPCYQVRKGIYEVKKVLKEKGVNLWVNGAVVFTNPGVKVFSEDAESIKIMQVNELESLFKEGKAYISPGAVESIANLIFEGFKKGGKTSDGRLHS